MQSCVHSFFLFFAKQTDPLSREGGQCETKHFTGMDKTIASLLRTHVDKRYISVIINIIIIY